MESASSYLRHRTEPHNPFSPECLPLPPIGKGTCFVLRYFRFFHWQVTCIAYPNVSSWKATLSFSRQIRILQFSFPLLRQPQGTCTEKFPKINKDVFARYFAKFNLLETRAIIFNIGVATYSECRISWGPQLAHSRRWKKMTENWNKTFWCWILEIIWVPEFRFRRL